MAFTDSADSAGAPDAGGMPDAGAGGGGPRPPPPGGGGALAALMQQRAGPQASAPGPGDQGNSLMMLKNAVDMIQAALPGLGAGSKSHAAALSALRSLSRFIPQGSPTAGVQQTQLMDLLRNTVRNALMQKMMQQGGGGGGRGQGQQAQAPMPSTPMPGA